MAAVKKSVMRKSMHLMHDHTISVIYPVLFGNSYKKPLTKARLDITDII